MSGAAESWGPPTTSNAAPSMFLETFLREEVGSASTHATTASAADADNDDDSEYGDIDWFGAGDVLSAAADRLPEETIEEACENTSPPGTSENNAFESSVDQPAMEMQEDTSSPPAPTAPKLSLEERRRRAALRRLAAERHRALSLCYVARLRSLSHICDDILLQAIALSLLPESHLRAGAFGEQLKALRRRSSNSQAARFPTTLRLALHSVLQGSLSPTAEHTALLLVARCRAGAVPARVAMEVPLPGAKSCASLLASDTLPLPRTWVEIFDRGAGRWTATMIDGSKASDVRSCPWVLAAGENGSLHDVTQRYCDRWTAILAARGSLARGWESLVGCFKEGSREARAVESRGADISVDHLDEQHLTRRTQREPFPKTAAAFKRHAGYALESQIRQNEMVYPSSAKPVGLFRGKEPIWRRSDIASLQTAQQWRRAGRQVREGEQALKQLRSGTAFAASLFGQWQTEELPQNEPEPEDVSSGPRPIPGTNEYGNLEFLTAAQRTNIRAHLPRGTVYIPGDAARNAAGRIRAAIPSALAVVGFRREPGLERPQPVFGGVVVWEHDEASIREAMREEQVRLEKEAEIMEAKRARQLCVRRKPWQTLNASPGVVDLG